MSDAIELRPISAGDAPAMARLQAEYLREVALTPIPEVDNVLHRLEAPGSDLGRDSLAALVGHDLVGFNVFLHSEDPRLWGMVSRPHRRRGIGTSLMSWGVGRARAQPGLSSVFVGTSSRRAEAHALYRQLGFTE